MAQTREQISGGITNDLIPAISEVFADNLESVILYGSYLKDSFVPGASDVNVLILLAKVEASQVREFGRRTHRLIRRYRITPQILSRAEFAGSADVFPLEYLDVVDTHKVVHGPDATDDLVLTRENLRHELEHQLRGNLLTLRQLAVATARPMFLGKRVQRKSLEGWYGSLGALLRGVLRLYNVSDIPSDARAVVAQVSEAVGLPPEPMIRLLGCRTGSCGDARALLNDVVTWLAELVSVVDSVAHDGEEPA